MREMFLLRLPLYWQPELVEILTGGSNSVQYQTADAVEQTADKHRRRICSITKRSLKPLFEATK